MESDGLLTLSIPPSARGVRHQVGIDFSIEYPPHDGSVDHLPLAPPPGNSGGGIWLIPGFEAGKIWLQEDIKLVAIARKWYKPSKEVWGTRIDFWLQLVWEDFRIYAEILSERQVRAFAPNQPIERTAEAAAHRQHR